MRIAAALLALIVAGCQATQPTAQTPQSRLSRIVEPPRQLGMSEAEMVNLFRRAVFEDETGGAQPLLRWDKPRLLVSVEGNASAPWFDYVRVVFAVLSQESGIVMDVAGRSWNADIVVSIFNGWSLESDVAQGDCGAQARQEGGRMVMGVIAIDASQQTDLKLMRSCLYEESFQSLGLTGETREGWPSLIDDRKNYTGLTPADRILLRTLYDPRLRTGMTWAQAEPIARKIIRENMAR